MTKTPPSLKLILGGVFGLLVLILVTLLSLTVEYIASRQIEQEAQTLLVILARGTVDRLARDLSERSREINVATKTIRVLQDPQASQTEIRIALEALQQTHPNYSWIGFADVDGRVVAATHGVGEGNDVALQWWFMRGRATPFVQDGRNSSLIASLGGESQYFVVFSAPVFTNNGEFMGVLAAILNWEWIQDLSTVGLQAVDDGRAIDMFVVTQHSELLSSPSGWSNRQIDMTRLTDSFNEESIDVRKWPDGNQYLTVASPIRASANYTTMFSSLGWLVVVRQPVQEAYSTAQRIRWLIVAIGGTYALVFTVVVWLLANRLTHQLQSITSAANRIRLGEDHVVIPLYASNAEVATLSASLNQLIEELTTATMAERNRIARELHDSVTQTLFSASMLADVLPRLWENDPERGKAKLEELRRAVRGALAEMRTLLLELRPAALIDTEMERLLRQLADATSGRSGVEVNWKLEGTCTLPPDVKVAFYRTVQEALSNVVKHADASQVDILLRCDGGRTELTIRDDGSGFDPADVSGDHFGLGIMRERIHAIAGELNITSQPNHGTTIQVLWANGYD
jgi:signal transduction histidine kinase